MATLPIVGTLDNGIRMRHGGPPLIRKFQEANSQTFKRGDFVYLSSGQLTICGTDPGAVLGIAMEDATNVTSGNAMIQTLILTRDTEICLQYYHATAASATYSDYSGILATGDITKYAAGQWMADMAGSGDVNVTVVDYGSDLGDIYMKLYCVITPAHLQMP